MKIEKIIIKIQTFLGISKPELIAVFILLIGVLIAYPAKQLYREQTTFVYDNSEFYRIIDSLSEISRTSYIGSTVNGESNPELAKADTIIEKEGLFANSKKKELSTDTKISLNNSSKTELMKLPNVGAATAIKIIEYRGKSPFRKISDLMNVKGIGVKKFDKMKPYLKL